RVETTINGHHVRVELATEYPFRERLDFTVTVAEPTKFAISLRIPGWASQPQLTIAGEQSVSVTPNTFHAIDREWNGETHFTLRLPMPTTIERRFNNAATIRRGPLVYSLPVGEDWKVLAGKPPQVTYQVLPKTAWNYALSLDEKQPAASIRFENLPIGNVPFSATRPPVKAFVQGKLLPAWKLERDAAAEPPQSPVESDQPLIELTLIPYGCARLRITEFPVLGK
ncbi:MAG: glycoside hydrolase family 127 protein, partial [Planctomycetes bacterium]|nr:glycoside hydrolase family 127 protein [Planctomycetota bacterium]